MNQCALNEIDDPHEAIPNQPARARNNVILLAEDEGPLRGVLSYVLEIEGFKVVTAADGLEALTVARLYNPLVAILDVMMPRLDGDTVCRAMKADLELSNAFVVLISALPPEQTAQRAFDAGADLCMSKPIDHEALLGVITEAFEHRVGFRPCRLLHS
jgi:DNA-binding response OmpR family regulator